MVNDRTQLGESFTSREHGSIQKWVEERSGKPAIVITKRGPSELLRVKFQDSKSENLGEISWAEFFRIFDKSKLDFLYQEKTKKGDLSRFFKFVRK